jgi:cytoskeletal protein CcmA (bactofilin family)
MKLPHKYMKNLFTSGTLRIKRSAARIALAATLLGSIAAPQLASAASSWKPTLIVNTESFQTIDEGDGTTDVEIRFGGTLNEKIIWNRTDGAFNFSDDVQVVGTLSGSALNVDRNATVGGTLTVSGAITGVNSITAKGALSGASLRVSGGGATIQGTLTSSGAFRTDSNVTINDDADTNDAVLTFGNSSGNQSLSYLNSSQRFRFSNSVSVLGTISGSTLRVDGNAQVGSLSASGSIRTEGAISGATLNIGGALTLRGVTYNAPTAQGNGVLTNDGAGNLTWAATSIGNGSGLIMSMHPEYPNAVYFSSGASYIGQLYGSGGTAGLENSYVWTSTRGTIQDYWISVRFRLPDNFSSWDPVKPIEFRYKTGTASAAQNHVSVRLKDTAGANVSLTGGGGLAATSWTTANITGPQAGGTWAPKGYATLYIKLAADSTAGANAAAGFVNLNYETTTP